MRAQQFAPSTVRALSRADLEVGEALARRVVQIIAHRLAPAASRFRWWTPSAASGGIVSRGTC